MHTTVINKADRAALQNLWGQAGAFVADTWTGLNAAHFDGQLRYHGVVWGLTPHGHRLGHTHTDGRITLHTELLDPRGDAWCIGEKLGERYAADVLLHEMVHAYLFDRGVDAEADGGHNIPEWCEQITRITPQLGLDPIRACPVKPRRVAGRVVRRALDGAPDPR